MKTRVQERAEDLRVAQDRATTAAASVAMVGLLVGLCAFFVTAAPHI